MKKLGRIHGLEDFQHSFKLLKGAGFDNINVDLMYGIPEQTKISFEKTLDFVMKRHIHCDSYLYVVMEIETQKVIYKSKENKYAKGVVQC